MLAGLLAFVSLPYQRSGERIEQGDRRLLENRFAEASAYYRSVAETGDWRGWERLGRVELEQGHNAAAVENFERSRALHANEPLVLLETAEAATRTGAYELARGCLREVLSLQPGCLEARLRMAQLETASGHPSTAETWLRHGLEISPRHPQLHWELACLLAARKDWAGAAAEYAAAVGANPASDSIASYQLGLAYMHTQNVAGALDAFRAAVDYNARNAPAWYMLGVLVRGQNPDEGRRCLQRVLDLRPEQALAEQARGLLRETRP